MRSKNITLLQSNSISLKNYQEERTYSPPKVVVLKKEPIRNKIHIGFFHCPLAPKAIAQGFFYLRIFLPNTVIAIDKTATV